MEADGVRLMLRGAIRGRNMRRQISKAFTTWYRALAWTWFQQFSALQGMLDRKEHQASARVCWGKWVAGLAGIKQQRDSIVRSHRVVGRAIARMQHAGVKAAVASWNEYVHFHRVAERTLRSMLYITLRAAVNHWLSLTRLCCNVERVLLKLNVSSRSKDYRDAFIRWSKCSSEGQRVEKMVRTSVRRWIRSTMNHSFQALAHNCRCQQTKEHKSHQAKLKLRVVVHVVHRNRVSEGFRKWSEDLRSFQRRMQGLRGVVWRLGQHRHRLKNAGEFHHGTCISIFWAQLEEKGFGTGE
eukprot:FR734613.1.p1 GENE.FR734613.1~~FR734613.1.p1  ORF type:complete len:334 (+),score=24.12 FR734613.1:113-1003(+)